MTTYEVTRKIDSKPEDKNNFRLITTNLDFAEKMFWNALTASKEIIDDLTIKLIKASQDSEHDLLMFRKEYD